jgi:effector-binding domain-containing protein
MLKIGEFSKISGLSIDALYHYEKMNILLPAQTDKYTGYRGYDVSQLVEVNKLLALKDAGFSLEEISGILNKGIPTADLLAMLETKAAVLMDKLKNDNDRLERLHTHIFLIKNNGIPLPDEVSIKRVEPILVASIRKMFSKDRFDAELEVLWSDVNEYITEKGGKRTVPCMMIYHHGWTDLETFSSTGADLLEVEVVEPIIKIFDENETVKIHKLPAAAKMACIVHQGSFSTIGGTCEILFNWFRQNKYTAAGTMREIYHRGDWLTENQEEYITELQIPIRDD